VYGQSALILEEFGIPDSRLSLDFFLPHNDIAFEFQGIQHVEFSQHFHRDKEGFRKQKERDASKRRWCELNDIRLVEVFEVVTAEKLQEMIRESDD
jgi:hypothetical protein